MKGHIRPGITAGLRPSIQNQEISAPPDTSASAATAAAATAADTSAATN